MKKKRLKVARAIEPNQGDVKAAALKIRRIVNAFERECKRDALALASKYCIAPVAADASLSIRKQQARAALIQQVKDDARRKIRAGEVARKVSKWFCRRLLREVTKTQKRTLQRAGISTAWLNKKWTVPIIRGQYISPEAAAKIPDFVDWSTSMITQMCERSAKQVQNALAEGITKGYSLSELTSKINALENMDHDRASRVALDQSCKLNQHIQIENAKAIGVSQGVWVHVPGQFSSRETHIDMNGKVFDLDKGMYDPDVNDYVMPAELPYCRCCFRPVLPKEITG